MEKDIIIYKNTKNATKIRPKREITFIYAIEQLKIDNNDANVTHEVTPEKVPLEIVQFICNNITWFIRSAHLLNEEETLLAK